MSGPFKAHPWHGVPLGAGAPAVPPGAPAGPVEIPQVYARDEAHAAIEASRADYLARFGEIAGDERR